MSSLKTLRVLRALRGAPRSPEVRLADLEPGLPLPPRLAPPAPLLPIAIGLILGIVADYELYIPTWSAVVLTAAGAAGALLQGRRAAIGFLSLLIAAAGLGALRHDLAFRRIAKNHLVRFTQDEPILAKLRGQVLSEPEIIEPDPNVPRAFEQGPRTRFILEALELAGRDGPIKVCGKVAMNIKAPLLLLRAGDVIELTGWLYRPPGPQNPGAYDWALTMRRAGILAAMSCRHAESVAVVERPSAGGQWFLPTARGRLSAYLLHDAFDDDDPGAGVIEAMVLGQRGAVSKAMNDAFVKTGNAHFLAASGMNVGWLALMGWGLMRLVGAYYRTTALVVAFLILSYVVLAEPEPSIVRAGVVGLLGCLAIFLRGRPSGINWLACSAIVVLMIDPCDLFRPGFQLSFIGVLAVMHFSKVVREIVGQRIAAITPRSIADFELASSGSYPSSLISGGDHWLHGLTNASSWSIAVCAACWIATAPLVCYTFGQFAPWAIFGTLILWVPAFLATLVGYLKVVLGIIVPSSAVVLGPLLAWTTSLMTGVVDVLAKLPYTVIDGRSPSFAWVLACYGLMAWRTYRSQWMKWRHGFKLLTLVLIVWWLIPPRWFTLDRNALQVWMLSVGDGSGNVIELPNGKIFVCDFGTRSPFDAGNQAIGFLKSRGIDRIDAVFVSHADFDHYSAIERLAREFHVGRLVINDQFEPGIREMTAPWHFLHAMRELHVPIELLHGKQRIDDTGSVAIEAIWPPPYSERTMPDTNDRSTVLRLTYQGKSILLPGDIADPAMRSLVDHGNLKAEVLALPHHGSVVSNTARFIDAVDPAVCVRSSGQRRAMTTNGIESLVGQRRYFSTADDGCVLVRIKDGRVSASPVMAGG